MLKRGYKLFWRREPHNSKAGDYRLITLTHIFPNKTDMRLLSAINEVWNKANMLMKSEENLTIK